MPQESEEDEGQPIRLERVANIVQKYFEWVGVFEKGNQNTLQCNLLYSLTDSLIVVANDEEVGDDVLQDRRHILRLYQTVHPDGFPSDVWQWVESEGVKGGNSDRAGIVFTPA